MADWSAPAGLWLARCGAAMRGGVARLFGARRKMAQQSLRVSEVASLGDRRFVAIVQCGDERFLIGGAGASVSLLSRLQRPEGFAGQLQESLSRMENGEQ